MSLKRVITLLGKEFLHGSKSYIFIFAIVAPIVISLMITLIFGTLFAEKPKLGIAGDDGSRVMQLLMKSDTLTTKRYNSDIELQQAVESGAVDMGVILPDGLDISVTSGSSIKLTGYLWGESLAKNRMTIGIAITDAIRGIAEQESPVNIETITLGEEVSIPWNDRLLPLIVLIAVFLGGLMLPATSVINEKAKKTLNALIVTPTTIDDIFAAKGLAGIILSLFMGILILVINQAFGSHPLLLTMMVILGGVMAAGIGLLLSVFIKDFTTLFGIWKSGAIILFAPVFIYLFPGIPQWVGRIFPTYYIIQPIVDLSQRGGSWPDIATNVFVLIGLNLILLGIVAFTLRRTQQLTA